MPTAPIKERKTTMEHFAHKNFSNISCRKVSLRKKIPILINLKNHIIEYLE